MRYIVPCSSCGTELRIPLDLGRLTVRCPRCYHSFVFDPEDPASFRGGRYDSPGQDPNKGNPRSIRGFFYFLRNSFDRIRSKFKKNDSLGWESPNSPGQRESYTPSSGFGPMLAKYILFALIFVGIVRACFYSSVDWNDSPNQQQWNPLQEKSPIQPQEEPEENETRPQVDT
ncbi:hypothetical protein EHQ53_02490 [Leptospira langatensis]|uniref:Uncharacterized protein n=1 Tax=Leptospira langatensis TaxID=2484983 RepID=A0A5F1ZZS6_9LEPT|nr:hypothetical protein [Leptospira langatensis]TGJ98604.1 hypothetical protein EHO57_18630 [Leptospira langatensis]TGL43517.1 hypothetical protein EHQ53_02490 [Leptospira langatensis]